MFRFEIFNAFIFHIVLNLYWLVSAELIDFDLVAYLGGINFLFVLFTGCWSW